ncbi:MAG: DUF4296 domain-containing protein [Bacteroidales bacterium]|nr:DUF4296 domain-containing protein [Bacteroidales bacterium]
MAQLRKYKIFGILLLTALFLSACKGNSEEKKGEVIDEEKFIDILVDVHIADAILSININYNNAELFVPENFYFQVLNNHGISREDFDRSIEYYADDPAVLQKIYEKVSEKIGIKESQIKGEKPSNEYGEINTQPDSVPIIP